MCFLFSRLVCAEEKPFNFSSLFYVIFLPFYYLYCISYILISFSHIILFLFSLSTWKKKSVYLTCGHNTRTQIFDVLLTVHLSTILAINQLNAQNLLYSKIIIRLYMFRALCAHHQEVKIVLYSIWYHHARRWPSRPLSTCAPDGHLQV